MPSRACACRMKERKWTRLRSLVSSPFLRCSCATRSKTAAIGSCCCSPFRALLAQPMGSCKELGHSVWLKQSGRSSHLGDGSWCVIDLCTPGRRQHIKHGTGRSGIVGTAGDCVRKNVFESGEVG